MEANFENMPQEKMIRYGIYGLIGIIVLVFLIIGIKVLLRKLKKDGVVAEAKKNVDNKNLSYSDYTYNQMASALWEAFSVWNGTDEETIYRNLKKLNNKDDWFMLISVYGKDKDNMNLVSQLIDELDSSELDKVNEILAKFGESI